jgi:predicted dehydrogenase
MKMAAQTVKVGVVGCGDIAYRSYLPVLTKHPRAKVTAVCDALPDRAQAAADAFGIPSHYGDFDQFLREADVEAVVVLTVNPAHASNTLAALKAGKHVCCEKMLAGTVAEADEIIGEASRRNLKLVAAPAVLLDGALKRVIELVRAGSIGKPTLVRGSAAGAGPATYWGYRSDPSWFYARGTGPMRDNGVYPLTTITGVLGPAKRVTALVGIAVPEVKLYVGPRAGETVKVEAPDNYTLLLDYGAGTFVNVDASYVVHGQRMAPTDFFGSEGAVSLWPAWHDGARVELYHDNPSLGVSGWLPASDASLGKDWTYGWSAAHLVDCILDGKRVVVSAEHHRHVMEIMEKAEQSSREGKTLDLTTTF